MGKLTLKNKLNLMKEIDISNKQHVEDWKKANMKIWVADYAFIDRDGNKHDWNPEDKTGFDGHRENFTYQVEALDIQEALTKAKEQISAMAGNRDWQCWTITYIGICNKNIW